MDKTWEKLLALFGALGVLLPTSPLNMPFTFRDSGVFLYVGWRILHGEIPYRDVWDHKPPVIFYVNALGLAIADNSRWGVWLIELVLLFFAALLGYLLIKRLFGILPAALGLLLFCLSLVPLIQGGNFTTEYTLPLQFAALWLLYHADQSERPALNFFLIGMAGAVAFFTKQTAVGVWLAIVVYLTVQKIFTKRGGQSGREIVFIALGGSTFIALVALFFAVQGTLPQFWSSAFEYNFVYSARAGSDLAARLDMIEKGIRPLARTGLFLFGAAGYIIAVGMILFGRRSMKGALSPLLWIGLVNLPIELILIGLPGRTFPHYYMTLLPVLALFSGLTFQRIFSLVSIWKDRPAMKHLLAAGLAGFFLWSSFDNYLNQVYTYRRLTRSETIVNYIQETTSPGDQVLIWGAESAVNYFAERKAPTRFVYQYPLHRTGYVTEEMIHEFLDDVIRDRPRLIVDTGTQDPLFGFPIVSDAIEEKTAYLTSRYCAAQRIASWTVYEYSEGGCDH
jgi:hypothetical protein